MAVEITWSAVVDDGSDPIVARRRTQILSVIEPDGHQAAAQILRWWFDDDAPNGWDTNWEHEFLGETDVTVFVVIHEPAHLAGCYRVDVQLDFVTDTVVADQSDETRIRAALTQLESAQGTGGVEGDPTQ